MNNSLQPCTFVICFDSNFSMVMDRCRTNCCTAHIWSWRQAALQQRSCWPLEWLSNIQRRQSFISRWRLVRCPQALMEAGPTAVCKQLAMYGETHKLLSLEVKSRDQAPVTGGAETVRFRRFDILSSLRDRLPFQVHTETKLPQFPAACSASRSRDCLVCEQVDTVCNSDSGQGTNIAGH